MQLHDTHFHLDLFKNPRQVIEAIEQAGIYTIAVTNLPELFDHTFNLTKDTKYVRAALGFHPELAAQHKPQISLFKKKIDLTRYIGEIGLDNYNKTPTDYLEQKKIFEKIVELCHEAGKKILTVHSRRSEKDILSLIGSAFTGKVVLHWYSGALKEIERAVEYGFYFSINLAMCQSENGKKIIERIPENRLLIETDGPFVKNGSHQSIPTDAKMIANKALILKSNLKYINTDESFFSDNFKSLIA